MKEVRLLLWGLEGVLIISAILLAAMWFGWKMVIIVLLILWTSSVGISLKVTSND